MATDVPLSPRTAETLKDLVRPGDVLAGKFRVERVIGVGGMGVVVAAMHLQLDQLVALKFLLPEPAKDPDIATRFSREARAAAKIRSEHVGRVIDVGTLETGSPYIVMEYLEGSDLSEVIEKHGPLPVSLAVDYVLQACEAVAEAHAAGIVHRDLKPQNLFLAGQADGTEIVKVLDFGISKATTSEAFTTKEASLTKTTDVFGSPLYMSPEQLKSSRNVDARADIWALGTILYELCTGDPPFMGGSFAEIGGKILYAPTPTIGKEGVPAALDAVVQRCLEKQPEQRYANVAELATALAPFGTHSAQESTSRVARVMRKAGLSLPEVRASGPVPPFHDSGPIAPTQAIPLMSPKGPAEGISSPSMGQATSHAWGQAGLPAPGRNKVRIAFAASALAFVALCAVFIVVVRDRGTKPEATTSATADESRPATPSATAAPLPAAEQPAPAPSGAPSVEPGYAVPPPPSVSATTAPRPFHGAKPAAPPTSRPTSATTAPQPAKPPAKDGEFGGRK